MKQQLTWIQMIRRSLVFYRRTHVWVIFGTALSTAILVGALMIGDSVRYSLLKIAQLRLGKTEFALTSKDRFLGIEFAASFMKASNTLVAPVLSIQGMGSAPQFNTSVNDLNIYGVDQCFWNLCDSPPELYTNLAENVMINSSLAARLRLNVGDEILLRFEMADQMPKELPFSKGLITGISWRLPVLSIVKDEQMGLFSLKNNQTAPYNVYVPLSLLARKLQLDECANMLLVAGRSPIPLQNTELQILLKQKIHLEDLGYHFKYLDESREFELLSDRVFIENSISEIALRIGVNPQPVLSYFVNNIRKRVNNVPYSFVTGIAAEAMQIPVQDHEIILNDWTAQELAAGVGDSIDLSFYFLDPVHKLQEMSDHFIVKDILDIQDILASRNYIPAIPGLVDVENCRDWDSSLPIDFKRIRKQDEDYWKRYGTTPKAFIDLSIAQKLWENQYGNLTSIRYPSDMNDMAELSEQIQSALNPVSFGLIFQPVKKISLEAGRNAQDFGQLFLGLSFFIIVVALLLTGLLFIFNVQQRTAETGLLLAIGIPRSSVQRLLFYEGVILATIGALGGALLGFAYYLFTFVGLKYFWNNVIGGAQLYLTVQKKTIVAGMTTGFLVSCLAMAIALIRQCGHTIRDLQNDSVHLKKLLSTKKYVLLSLPGLTGVLAILLTSNHDSIAAFFIAGILLLTSLLLLCRAFLNRIDVLFLNSFSLPSLAIKNLNHKPGRSLVVIALMACGLFVIFAVGANRQSAVKEPWLKSSATGGYTMWGQTTIPILNDLDSLKVRRDYNLGMLDSINISFMQMRLHAGDDASCLNLNHVQQPHVLGLNPAELAQRGAFSFIKTIDIKNKTNPWLLLEQEDSPDIIPAIADYTVLRWGLKKNIGDTVRYNNSYGKPIYLKIVAALTNSIFQGNILISEKNFVSNFSGESGYRCFLIDAPVEKYPKIREQLSWALQDFGIELSSTLDRLKLFNSVQDTYLSIFLALGGLGLIIGSCGITIVVFKNVAERQSELAILKAVGWQNDQISRLLISEHLLLLVLGILIGLSSSLIAVQPALSLPDNSIPWLFIALLLIAVFMVGMIATFVSTCIAMQKDLLTGLRNE